MAPHSPAQELRVSTYDPEEFPLPLYLKALGGGSEGNASMSLSHL